MSLLPNSIDEIVDALAPFRINASDELLQLTDRFVKNFNALMPGADTQPQAIGVMLLTVVGCVLQDYRGTGGMGEALQFTSALEAADPELKDRLPIALALAGQQLYTEGTGR